MWNLIVSVPDHCLSFIPNIAHTEPQNVKWEEKLPIIFTPAEDRTRDPLHAHPNLYCTAIKAAGLPNG